MENTFLNAILTRLKIGGLITQSDHTMILKHLLTKITELEEKMDAAETTTSSTRNSKVSKKKTAAS